MPRFILSVMLCCGLGLLIACAGGGQPAPAKKKRVVSKELPAKKVQEKEPETEREPLVAPKPELGSTPAETE